MGLMHYNLNMPHQCDHANAFKSAGFDTTPSPYVEAHDFHVISGPHFAFEQWKHSTPLMIDRAWWGDPDCVAIFWLMPDGSRKYATGTAPRPKPELQPLQPGEDSCLILADYGQDVSDIAMQARQRYGVVNIRKHPANGVGPVRLGAQIAAHDICIGSKGTSMFEAIKQGKPTVCLDDQNACAPVCSPSVDAPLNRGDRSEWMHEMSYKQFSLDEIADGTAWENLKDVL